MNSIVLIDCMQWNWVITWLIIQCDYMIGYSIWLIDWLINVINRLVYLHPWSYRVLDKIWTPHLTNLSLLNHNTFWNFWQNMSRVVFFKCWEKWSKGGKIGIYFSFNTLYSLLNLYYNADHALHSGLKFLTYFQSSSKNHN